MHKVLALVATICVATVSASTHETINNRFTLAMMNQQAIRERYGLRSLAIQNPEHPALKQEDPNAEPTTPSAFDVWDCARGFAKGLQFSSTREGSCYISIDETINAADDITTLILKFYNPTVWADLMTIQANTIQYIAAVQTNCDFQKLLNTLTTSPSTLIPQIIARVGGGFVAEIPDLYYRMKTAPTCGALFLNGAKIFSMVFDYYI